MSEPERDLSDIPGSPEACAWHKHGEATSDRLKLIFWDGTGLVMIYKHLEEQGFVWPAIRDGVMSLSHARFEALFAGLDWRPARRPAEAE